MINQNLTTEQTEININYYRIVNIEIVTITTKKLMDFTC